MQPQASSQPWQDPLTLARAYAGADSPLVLLYSGVQAGYSGQRSLLAFTPEATLEGEDFSALDKALLQGGKSFLPAWFGYLGYELGCSLEQLPRGSRSWVHFPTLWMTRFRHVCEFDHAAKQLYTHSPLPAAQAQEPPAALPSVAELASNMTKEEYLRHVATIIEQIRSGNLYQANLTRKFYGRFTHAPDTLALFARLCEASPAAYSAYIRTPHGAILSSSPERFLTIDAKGHVEARPIKGSAGRHADARSDAQQVRALTMSEKDRAENLMIVDLMRNDLSRSCDPGSIEVPRIFEVTSHATVHHLSSTITGKIRGGKTALDVVKGCFPPGSMTGAPKLRAIGLCHALEQQERGVYSGALGWLGADGSADLSVVIRTLLVQGDKFEFQVGGGIVADSDPLLEWQETLIKARGIGRALGVPEEQLAVL